MNLYQQRLMDKPSIKGDRCAFCGRMARNRHHIVYRSQGGQDGPTVPVCGFGNAEGCHGELHMHRLHIDYDDSRGWVAKRTETSKKDVWIATDPQGWVEIRGAE